MIDYFFFHFSFFQNIVKFFDHIDQPQSSYLIMEFISGKNLKEFMNFLYFYIFH